MTGFRLKPPPLKRKSAAKKLFTLSSNDKMWESTGVISKPNYCKEACPLYTATPGIVQDWMPRHPKIALLLPTPSKGDMIENTPFKGNMGAWWKRHLIYPLGLKMEDVAVSHVLRCYCGSGFQSIYPTGDWQRKSEVACRHFDNYHCSEEGMVEGGLCQWDPNMFVITHDFNDIIGTPAFYRQVVMDLQKALNMTHYEFRPLVLCGKEPMKLVAPWTDRKGGVKDWRGHFWEGEYPFKRGFVTPRRFN